MAISRLTDADLVAQIREARALARKERRAGKRAKSARYDAETERVVLELTNGYAFAFPVKAIAALRRARPEDIAQVELWAGSILHWERLDMDLSVPALLLSA